MSSSAFKRRNAPLWPPFKPTYQSLSSTENFKLSPFPSAALSDASSATAYTPSHTPSKPVEYTQPGAQRTRSRWRGRGWKSSARLALYGGIFVLVFNIIVAIVISAVFKLNMGFGLSKVYQGSCRRVEAMDTWVHFAINVISTILLASSNYCMQLLCNPTRDEVNKAHAKRKWLDIGVPSLRNSRAVSKTKVVWYWALMLSSIPLHLFYNSIFYSAIATNDYNILLATPDFATGATYNETKFPDSSQRNITDIQARASTFQRLDNADCISAYSEDFVPDRRNVIVVVTANSTNSKNSGSILEVMDYEFPLQVNDSWNQFAWICDSPDVVNNTQSCCENQWGFIPCTTIAPKLQSIANTWDIQGNKVQYCLSEEVPSQCHLHFALPLMVVVIVFNIVKVLGMAYVALRLDDIPLSTIGDAIQSFIRFPDPASERMCLANHESVLQQYVKGYDPTPMRYTLQPYRWYAAATKRQWLMCISLLSIATIGTMIALIAAAVYIEHQTNITNILSIGLGNVRPQNLLRRFNSLNLGSNGVLIATIVANLPQAIFSFIYVVYNTIFTQMLMSYEWSKLSLGPKPLRTSHPVGQQKSTHFLHIPLKYGLPLIIGSGLLHWFVSQAIFLANISIIPRDGITPMQDEIITCGYSPLGMILVIVLCVVLMGYLTVMALRKLPTGMPLVCSNSLAISAACHVGSDKGYLERDEMVGRPLMWGVVPSGKSGWDVEGEEVGHCAFSDGQVVEPRVGKLYE